MPTDLSFDRPLKPIVIVSSPHLAIANEISDKLGKQFQSNPIHECINVLPEVTSIEEFTEIKDQIDALFAERLTEFKIEIYLGEYADTIEPR